MPVGPPATSAVVSDPSALRAITQPDVPVPEQSAVKPKKKKSVPPTPTLGLRNSVHPVQRAVVEISNCAEKVGFVFMTYLPATRVKPPKAYCQGVSSAAPVPHSRSVPVVGSLK